MNMHFGKHLKMSISFDILTFTFSGLKICKDCSVINRPSDVHEYIKW